MSELTERARLWAQRQAIGSMERRLFHALADRVDELEAREVRERVPEPEDLPDGYWTNERLREVVTVERLEGLFGAGLMRWQRQRLRSET